LFGHVMSATIVFMGGITGEAEADIRHTVAETPLILVVDDESAVARTTERILTRAGFAVVVAEGGREAIAKMDTTPFDVIVSDLAMPDMDGRALLRAVRANDLDVPFVFLTGQPDLQSAIEAVEYGAFGYLVKPAPPAELTRVVQRAARWHRLAVVRRAAAPELDRPAIGDRAGLEARFASALRQMWIAAQPIVSWQRRVVVAYEMLTRTDEPTLANPSALFDVAERLSATRELGRAIRRLAAAGIREAPRGALVFVNLHPLDLDDEELFSNDGALSPFAGQIVLEITERATLDTIRGLQGRIQRLRELGFQIAVDDLGAGYAGLSSFAALEPDVVKADMSLVRGIESSPVKQKLLGAISALARDLRIRLIAEGIETVAERECVTALGADVLQGYLFARPGRGFPEPKY
jgi:EAL domain-containing protein (putative c-di-GMP-specific phosphodiesterase class I)/CheY-like chemotaxis protein